VVIEVCAVIINPETLKCLRTLLLFITPNGCQPLPILQETKTWSAWPQYCHQYQCELPTPIFILKLLERIQYGIPEINTGNVDVACGQIIMWYCKVITVFKIYWWNFSTTCCIHDYSVVAAISHDCALCPSSLSKSIYLHRVMAYVQLFTVENCTIIHVRYVPLLFGMFFSLDFPNDFHSTNGMTIFQVYICSNVLGGVGVDVLWFLKTIIALICVTIITPLSNPYWSCPVRKMQPTNWVLICMCITCVPSMCDLSHCVRLLLHWYIAAGGSVCLLEDDFVMLDSHISQLTHTQAQSVLLSSTPHGEIVFITPSKFWTAIVKSGSLWTS